jgi:hypothetical protein
MQRHAFFAEIGGFFVILAAFGNEFRASKHSNSKVAVLFVSPGA